MELARKIYISTEEFPKSETFGLRMQLRRSAVAVASHIAEAHGRLNDAEMRKGLGSARAALNELETQAELASGLGFFQAGAQDELFDLSSEVGKLINRTPRCPSTLMSADCWLVAALCAADSLKENT